MARNTDYPARKSVVSENVRAAAHQIFSIGNRECNRPSFNRVPPAHQKERPQEQGLCDIAVAESSLRTRPDSKDYWPTNHSFASSTVGARWMFLLVKVLIAASMTF